MYYCTMRKVSSLPVQTSRPVLAASITSVAKPIAVLCQASRCCVSRQTPQLSVVGAGTVQVRLWLQIHILSCDSLQLVLNEYVQQHAVVF